MAAIFFVSDGYAPSSDGALLAISTRNVDESTPGSAVSFVAEVCARGASGIETSRAVKMSTQRNFFRISFTIDYCPIWRNRPGERRCPFGNVRASFCDL